MRPLAVLLCTFLAAFLVGLPVVVHYTEGRPWWEAFLIPWGCVIGATVFHVGMTELLMWDDRWAKRRERGEQ